VRVESGKGKGRGGNVELSPAVNETKVVEVKTTEVEGNKLEENGMQTKAGKEIGKEITREAAEQAEKDVADDVTKAISLENKAYVPYTDERRKYIIPPKDGYEAYLERQYIEIRKKGIEDVSIVAKNTGLTEQEILEMKNHLFLKTHNLSVEGKPYTELYFQADSEVAHIWKKAQKSELTLEEKEWFRQLANHELTESKYMKDGMPLRDISTYDKEMDRFIDDSIKNAHDKANVTAAQPGDLPGYDGISDYLKYYDKSMDNY